MQQFHPIAFVDIFYGICITSYIWYLCLQSIDDLKTTSWDGFNPNRLKVEIAKRAKGSLYGSISVSSAQPSL